LRQFVIAALGISILLFFGSGCPSEPGIDKKKFSDLNRTARDVQTFISSGKPCDVPDTVLQRLDSAMAALKDKTTSKGERDLMAGYSNLMTTYKDALLLCTYRTHLAQFQFVPKGRIYVFQELDPLVQKYDLSTESHVYQPTGLHWRSIGEDSIEVIRESAERQLKSMENMVNYN
jgi:hypothetical protein